MIHAITYDLRSEYNDLIEDMYRARHRLYVEGRKWRELAKADGREIDQFDTENAIYLLALNKNRELRGGVRLVPSTSPHLLDTIFPQFCANDIPRGTHIWEMSRLFVSHNDRYGEEGVLLKGEIFCGLLEFAARNGITEITGVSDSYFLPRLLEIGIVVRPLGIPKPYQSGEMVAFHIILHSGDIEKAQSHYGISGSVLLPLPGGPYGFPMEKSHLETFELETALDSEGDLASEFRSIVPLLATGDARKLADAERQLDDLTARVRQKISEAKGLQSIGGALN